MGTPLYSNPAGHTGINILRDIAKIPLFVAIDITVGETSMYADYIFPDLTYLERWEIQGSHPSVPEKVQPIRQPAVAPLTDTVAVFGQEMPLSLETFLLGLAEKLQLPGFGLDGFATGVPFTHQDHFYLRMAANVAAGDTTGDEVPDASADEMQLFQTARRHLPGSVFDINRWQSTTGSWWPKVVYVLNRGGRFQNRDNAYTGEQVTNKYGTLINMFQEKTSKVKNALTGEKYNGYAKYIPAPSDFRGATINTDPSYPFRLITYREISHTKSRTIADYWLLAIRPENVVLINRADASSLGITSGDTVRVVSSTNPDGVWDLGNGDIIQIVGKVKAIEGIRPGVVAFSLGHGHWAYGSRDIAVDGATIRGDNRRRKGLHANAVMLTDPTLTSTPLTDIVGGSAVFYDTNVNLVKVA
jgi:anaerobic selenocysteine-containing dehydrogenase